MTDTKFVPGQRWVSATEAELGLGVVVELDGRLVLVSFPAAGERRTYAVDNAPLGRVRYAVGDEVETVDGLNFVVTVCQERAGLLFYEGSDSDGTRVMVPELELESAARFLKPQDRLFAGQIDRNRLFELRGQTLTFRHRHRASKVFGFVGPRIQLLPHQLYIASQVANRHAPRVLLADEVGLGKTVEAGLIIHQQIASGRARRVLIVLPEALIHQWLVEMLRRFSLRFTILDEERCEDLEASGSDNPFETAQLVMVSLSLLESSPRRLEQALDATWDTLVVDEAHHLQWSAEESSAAYSAVETLAEATPGVVLLTATPEQLGIEGHFARLRLLDPHRYPNLESFVASQAGHRPLRELIDKLLVLVNAATTDISDQIAELQPAVAEYLGEAAAAELVGEEGGSDLTALERAVDSLLDRHGTGRVLFRNTRAAIGGFPARELLGHRVEFSDGAFQVAAMDSLTPELLAGDNWIQDDPRVDWLVQFLNNRRAEKILVICTHDATARSLEEHLRTRAGVRSAVFHADAELVARDRAAAYFAEVVDGAQVLVCSEVGSEGRNFQFARDLVLFDLPANPEVLEQRIGRLDRIGQIRSVRIHVPYMEGSAGAKMMRWYHEGLAAFEEPCAIGQRMMAELGGRLETALVSKDIAEFDGLVADTIEKAAELNGELLAGRDRLLELNSCRLEPATDVVHAVLDAQKVSDLSEYLERLLDYFGVEQERNDATSVILRPGERLLHNALPGLPEEGLTATFSRTEALVREEFQFLSWEHPLVDGAMESLATSGAGNTTLCTATIRGLKAGSLVLDARFIVHCPARRQLQVERFIADPVVRVVCDEAGRDLSKVLTESAISSVVRGVPGRSAHELVKHARDRIAGLIDRAQILVDPLESQITESAMSCVRDVFGAEIDRLAALAQINSNVRPDEIETRQSELSELEDLVPKLRLTLDALRVIVVTPPN
ncbi:MAG: RNA polymerase-associated protein RapA [Chromatiales bacterium]|jgi:ATP-dependent helicase HepA|nr:RNA polymerase-associated protein RapA [Chromatiales bacterium]